MFVFYCLDYRVWKERLPSETWLLARHSSSLLCARQMLSEVILEIFFWYEWNSVDTNPMNFLKTTPLSLFTLGTTLPGTPSPNLSPYFSFHPALCQGRCPPPAPCSREWVILVFSGSTCVPSQLSRSCLCSLGSEQPTKRWTLGAESVDGARTTCLWRSSSLILLAGAAVALIEKVCRADFNPVALVFEKCPSSQPLRHVFAYGFCLFLELSTKLGLDCPSLKASTLNESSTNMFKDL